MQSESERWLNSVALFVFLVFFGGVLLIGAPSQWPLAVQVLYIVGMVAYGTAWLRQRFRQH